MCEHWRHDADAGRFRAGLGGDCIDDAAAMQRWWDGSMFDAAWSRRHRTAGATFLRSLRWGLIQVNICPLQTTQLFARALHRCGLGPVRRRP